MTSVRTEKPNIPETDYVPIPNGLDFDRLGGTNPVPTTVPVEPPTNPKEQRP